MKIGPYQLQNNLILAPMAGITDRPFRNLCKRYGAGLAVSEMVASNPALRKHKRTLLKADHTGETGLRSVQILGTNPKQMAAAAQFNAQRGAQIIDINMGCPAKKVCSVAAGSALLRDENLVSDILQQVVQAVNIPVTLKIRTGWDKDNRNAVNIARVAEQSGIAALTVHGRTRACAFKGAAEYDTIKAVKSAVAIPVIANGDIDSVEKAKYVLDYTSADAIMIGRAAQGRPWFFQEIQHYLQTGEQMVQTDIAKIKDILMHHLQELYLFYGALNGVRIGRKHIGWYFDHLGSLPAAIKQPIYQTNSPENQLSLVSSAFDLFNNTLPLRPASIEIKY
ncbi:tRNA-dihydrouridine synthase B [Bathymodiolus japonicus methanotrophic gill symbiont]|uniref:tRNA dihydrouridine synthase DusB n=1 Tax=Bathymodiolus japonicus methanotrophic gill symbiont TaxID=113269 RepID=UPI001B3F7CBE|nr:tRNA dihydrouridine synthase DusB [Bathymodiolus japonicus methanotrophic gill symbiont]GFO72384.1 tRNA-dihydrouridine synthase B [Bathymodiolus japonicus methanotrophic gill symbiont]